MSDTAIGLKKKSKSSRTWIFTIEKFSKYNEIDQELKSPNFGLADDDVWNLQVYPNGEESNNGEYLGVYFLCKEVEYYVEPKLKYKFSIISTNFEKAFEFQGCHPGLPGKSWGQGELARKSELFANKNLYLPNDTLTISCKITRSFDHYATEFIGVSLSEHLKTLQSLLQNAAVGELVTLRISQTNQQKPTINKDNNESTGEAKEFKVYQGILTSQSPVFKAMFEHKETKESQENLIEINDMDPQVCDDMLHFLHKDQLRVSKNNLMKLLAAADKYQLSRLKELCEEALFETLSKKNSLIILRDADVYNADQLKEATIEFIVEHIDDIKESDEYKLFKQKHLALALEIFEKFYDKQKEDD